MVITNDALKEIAIKANKLIDSMLDEFEDSEFYDVKIEFTSQDGLQYSLLSKVRDLDK